MSETQQTYKPESPQALPSNGRAPRKRRFLLLLLAVLLLAGLPYGIHLYRRIVMFESTDDAFIEGHVIPISARVAGHVAEVAVTDNQPVQADQLLLRLDPTDLETRLAQSEAALAAARSRADQARIDVALTSTTSRAGVSQATYGVEKGQSGVRTSEAQLRAAQSQVAQARAALTAAEAGLEEAQANVARQQAAAERANADAERYRKLFDDGVVSRQQFDLYRTTADQANAELRAEQKSASSARADVGQAQAALQAALQAQAAAESQVRQAQAATGEATGKLEEVNVTPERVAQSQSALAAAEAEVRRLEALARQARLDLSYTRVRAPEAGRVTKKTVEPGMYVQVGQPLLSVVPPRVWVVANFKETQLTHMRPGQPARIEVDAYPDRVFRGHVDSIQRGTGARFSLFPPENATGNFIKVVQRVPVKIVFDEPPQDAALLAPGMSVVPRVKVR